MATGTGFGLMPVPFTEIRAAAPWAQDREVKLIRQMSDAFIAGNTIGKDPFGIPPYTEDN